MKKFLKNLFLRNRWSDFEIISQESEFDISGCPDCPIRTIIATGMLPSPFKFSVRYRQLRVFIADTSSIWSLISDTQINVKLFTEFHKKKLIDQKTWLLWETHFPLMV